MLSFMIILYYLSSFIARISDLKITSIIFLVFLGISCTNSAHKPEVSDDRPNILLIVADDMAYSDLGCFGSEIRTPNIDQLAKEGLLFTQFHAGPQCAPSRAMLISGSDNHMAGVGRQDVPRDSKWYGQRGYERNLSDRIIPFPQLLQESGYFTCLSGKWHLGYDSFSWPHLKGYDKSFGQLNGGGNHFLGLGLGVEGIDTISEWTLNGKTVLYPDGRYSTELHTENILNWIKENKETDDKPWYAFAAYSSPHWPLQVPDDWLDKYQGVYDSGYEQLKKNRFKALKEKGFIPKDLEMPDYATAIKPWNDLSDEEQKISSRKMELYAAMVENLDHHIGALRKELEAIGEWENTLVVFFSDNGAAHRDFYAHPERGAFLRTKYDNSYENMGKATSFISYGKEWAMSSMVPFKWHKTYATEGGMIVPAIISGKTVKARGVSKSYINIMDMAPSFLDLAEIDYDKIYKERKKPHMRGASILPLLSGELKEIHDDDKVFALEFNGSIFLKKGPWKLVNYQKPYHPDNFELFNIIEDPAEMKNLKDLESAKFNELLSDWNQHLAENKILLQDPEEAKKYNY